MELNTSATTVTGSIGECADIARRRAHEFLGRGDGVNAAGLMLTADMTEQMAQRFFNDAFAGGEGALAGMEVAINSFVSAFFVIFQPAIVEGKERELSHYIAQKFGKTFGQYMLALTSARAALKADPNVQN